MRARNIMLIGLAAMLLLLLGLTSLDLTNEGQAVDISADQVIRSEAPDQASVFYRDNPLDAQVFYEHFLRAASEGYPVGADNPLDGKIFNEYFLED